jgi:Zn finger protein HypA/HybF involved in hydrogenase expression
MHSQDFDEVHCLKCDSVWTEYVYLKVCPHCGNQDTEKTVYLTKEEANE